MTVGTLPRTQPDAGKRPPGRRRVLRLVLLASVVVLVVLLVVLVAVIHRLNTPAGVPSSWRAPTVLPRSVTAAVPPGNLVFDSNRTGNYEIWTMGPTGVGPTQLTHDPSYDSWWARLSPDRRTILFYRAPAGVHDRDYSATSLWAMAADGTDLVELRPAGLDGWVFQGHAEWSPDGTELTMFGGRRWSPQIWITNRLGQAPRQLTDRGGSNIDPSWSPDGRTIAFVGCPSPFCVPADHEIYTTPAAGGPVTRITNDAYPDNDPYFSHDGTELAWLTKLTGGPLSVGTWDIRIAPVIAVDGRVELAPGAAPRLLVADHHAVDSKPSWSLDDRTIYFHRAVGSLVHGFQIWAISPDGSGLREITNGQRGSNEYPGT